MLFTYGSAMIKMSDSLQRSKTMLRECVANFLYLYLIMGARSPIDVSKNVQNYYKVSAVSLGQSLLGEK